MNRAAILGAAPYPRMRLRLSNTHTHNVSLVLVGQGCMQLGTFVPQRRSRDTPIVNQNRRVEPFQRYEIGFPVSVPKPDGFGT